MNDLVSQMNGDTGSEIVLGGAYPRVALDILREYGFVPDFVIRELNLSQTIHTDSFVQIQDHWRIIEFGRANISNFRVKMAERCGINTLGPLMAPIMSARCAREALLIASIYIPLLDKSAQLDLIDSSNGLILKIQNITMSEANAQDFAYASFCIAASIVAAGLATTDFVMRAQYYNMGPLGKTIKYGSHIAKTDDGPRRLEIWLPTQVADRPWPQSTEEMMRHQLDMLDEALAAQGSRPTLLLKIEKLLSSAQVRTGKPMATMEEVADHVNLDVATVNARLKKHNTTLKKKWLQYAVKHAEILAIETNKSVDEINALTLQASSASNFARTFKQHTGTSVSEIRQT